MENKQKSFNILTGFALGSAVGAIVTLLYAPASGEETRRRIREEVSDAQWRATNAFENVQSKATNLVDDVREDLQQRAIRLKSIGQYVLEDEKATVEQSAKEVKSTVEQGASEVKSTLQQGTKDIKNTMQQGTTDAKEVFKS
jgi:gas vesicle protein